MRKGKIGIIANPQSGRDIRRLVAHASVFDNEEKVNIVERMLSVFNELGLSSLYYMPDSYGIVEKASERLGKLNYDVNAVNMLLTHSEEDSTTAGNILQKIVDLIIVIGGDGTHRAVVKGLDLNDPVPIVGISTGTNNVFPSMVEATTVAIASYAFASGIIKKEDAAKREKIIKINWNDNEDIALIDVVFSNEKFVGSRAIWNPESLHAVFASRAEPFNIGFSSLPGILAPSGRNDPFGSYIILGQSDKFVKFAIAPGKIVNISFTEFGHIYPGLPYKYSFNCGTIALDGERKIEIFKSTEFLVSLVENGPYVLDINKTIKLATESGLFNL
jgi:predicted polyphosphate/ATP-dependent NAD kinase